MRIRFDNAMSQSNAHIMEEWKAMGTARRLQAENDALAARVHDGELLTVPDSMHQRAAAHA